MYLLLRYIFAAKRKLFDYNKSEVFISTFIRMLFFIHFTSEKERKKKKKNIQKKSEKLKKKHIENCLWFQTFPIEEKAIFFSFLSNE